MASPAARVTSDKTIKPLSPASVFIKREAEDPLESILAKPESPYNRRSRIFQSLAEKPAKLETKPIFCPDQLTDYELKECYDIAKAAMTAQFEHRQVNAAVMEEFLKAVFLDWNALEEPPVQQDLKHFPFSDQSISNTKIVIGTMTMGK